MEFCSGGSCSDLMRAGRISEEYIMIILRELLLGLDYLHNDNKLHRDVKGMPDKSFIQVAFSLLIRICSCKCVAYCQRAGQAG